MKRFDVCANIIAGFLVWAVVTAIVFFFLSWGSDDPMAPAMQIWPRVILILISASTFWLYAKRYWKKLER